jgi:hypothetical protein
MAGDAPVWRGADRREICDDRSYEDEQRPSDLYELLSSEQGSTLKKSLHERPVFNY